MIVGGFSLLVIAIAEGTGNTHQAILKLLSKHQARFNKSQRVGFEIQSFETKGGVQTRSIAKRHDNVLRAIENIDCSPEFLLLSFELVMESMT